MVTLFESPYTQRGHPSPAQRNCDCEGSHACRRKSLSGVGTPVVTIIAEWIQPALPFASKLREWMRISKP
jgi:hypothetical protein